MEMIYPWINGVGLGGIVIVGVGLGVILLGGRAAGSWLFRIGVIAAGGICWGVVLYLSRLEFHILSYLYLVVMGGLLAGHVVALAVVVGRMDWRREEEGEGLAMDPLLLRALAAERQLNYAAAVRAYDEYLEGASEDAAVRGRLAEALIKAGNAKRAVSVLTLGYTQAEEAKLKIALGIRLAEVILVSERDPVSARRQLEQLRTAFLGTEHEKYVEELAGELVKRVAEGRYLKKKPDA